MRKRHIYVGILAGGKGERLWPKSRAAFPKQNLKLMGKRSIFQDTFYRAMKIAKGNIFIITNKDSAPDTISQLKGFRDKTVVIEPIGRNTAPAVGLASVLAHRRDRDAVLIIMPSDHLIADSKRFFRVINTAVKEAMRTGSIITLGIRPHSASSAYGYIGIKDKTGRAASGVSYKIARFIEKPKSAKAKRLISSGRYFWNSGIFIFKASVMLSVLKEYMPVLYGGLRMLPSRKKKSRFNKELKKVYGRIKGRSLDYAVMEKSRNIRVIPSDFAWNDVGSFDSIARLAKKDKDGNNVFGEHVGVGTKGSVIFSDKGCLVGTVGIKDIIVVATADAVLVCDRKQAGDIRKLVAKIRKNRKLRRYL